MYSQYVNGGSNSADSMNKSNDFNSDVDRLGRPLSEFNGKNFMLFHELGELQQ